MNRRGQDRTGALGGSGMVSLWGAQSLILSVQRGLITIANTATSGTATITAVDPNNAIVLYGGLNGNPPTTDSQSTMWAIVTLTNSTTVTASRVGSTNSLYMPYQVIEFAPGVLRSLQSGTVTLLNVSSNTATISAVNPAKAFVVFRGWTTTSGSDATSWDTRYQMPKHDLTSATVVTATTHVTNIAVTLTLAHTVVEFF